jgi:hypothetical protein
MYVLLPPRFPEEVAGFFLAGVGLGLAFITPSKDLLEPFPGIGKLFDFFGLGRGPLFLHALNVPRRGWIRTQPRASLS